MKRTVSCLLALLMLVGLLPAPWGTAKVKAAGSNLLVNGGFEETASASGWTNNLAPAGWTRYVFTGSPAFSVDSTVAHTGQHSVRLDAASTSRGTVFQQTGVEVGKTYRISGWMKTENVSGKGLVRIQAGRTSGGNLLVNMAEATGSKDWFYFEHEIGMWITQSCG